MGSSTRGPRVSTTQTGEVVRTTTNAPTRPYQPRSPTPAAFNYLSSQGYTFLCVADDAYGRTIPFAFLEKVRDEWFAKWADKGASASAHALDRSFGARLKYWMEYCETHPDEVSKAAEVQKKVDEVKGIMIENIERVLERGEKIELLVDKCVFALDSISSIPLLLGTRMARLPLTAADKLTNAASPPSPTQDGQPPVPGG